MEARVTWNAKTGVGIVKKGDESKVFIPDEDNLVVFGVGSPVLDPSVKWFGGTELRKAGYRDAPLKCYISSRYETDECILCGKGRKECHNAVALSEQRVYNPKTKTDQKLMWVHCQDLFYVVFAPRDTSIHFFK